MNVKVTHNGLGDGWLTNEHSASSYGQPVYVADADHIARGPLDMPIGHGGGYIHSITGHQYTVDELAWIESLILAHLDDPPAQAWVDCGPYEYGGRDYRVLGVNATHSCASAKALRLERRKTMWLHK